MDVDIRECRAGELAGRDARLPIRTKTARRADDAPGDSARRGKPTRHPGRAFPRGPPPGRSSTPLPLWHVASSAGSRQAFQFRFVMARTFRASSEARATPRRSNMSPTSPQLEIACNRARYAADIRPLDAKVLSSLRAAQLSGLRLSLHPSVFLVQSRFPIVTVWERNRSAGDRGMIERWRAEEALVARPFAEVEVRRLPPGGRAFIGALSQGQTIAAAIKAGVAAAPVFDSDGNLAFLIGADVVVGIRQPARAAA